MSPLGPARTPRSVVVPAEHGGEAGDDVVAAGGRSAREEHRHPLAAGRRGAPPAAHQDLVARGAGGEGELGVHRGRVAGGDRLGAAPRRRPGRRRRRRGRPRRPGRPACGCSPRRWSGGARCWVMRDSICDTGLSWSVGSGPRRGASRVSLPTTGSAAIAAGGAPGCCGRAPQRGMSRQAAAASLDPTRLLQHPRAPMAQPGVERPGIAGRSQDARPPSRAKLYGLLALMLLIWSANFLFAKMALREVPGAAGGLPAHRPLRRPHGPAVPAGGPGQPIRRCARFTRARPARAWRPSASWASSGTRCCSSSALSHTSVAHGALVVATAPVLVLLGTAVLGHERLTRGRLAGMLAAAAGVAMLQLGHKGGLVAGVARRRGDADQRRPLRRLLHLREGRSPRGGHAGHERGRATGAARCWRCPSPPWGSGGSGRPHVGAAAWTGIALHVDRPVDRRLPHLQHALRWLPASRVASVTYLQPVLATHPGGRRSWGSARGWPSSAARLVILFGVWLVQRVPGRLPPLTTGWCTPRPDLSRS